MTRPSGWTATGSLLARIVLRPLALVLSRAARSSFAQAHIAPRMGPVQLWLYRRTGGRVQISALLVPTLLLVSRGARSGARRETPLMCWPLPDGSFYVAGSNWGRSPHPSWTWNLLAHPEAEVIFRRRPIPVQADLLEGSQRSAAWPVLDAQWPNYRAYEERSGRPMRIFRLVPVDKLS
ncbi:MAG TPA: nitroreductase family deazaflavin-dependent oxidoreductase [Jatrophihabitantaceae bacterium]|nr:nitroreductase family deazaflavin-dependent oxidoreductase [Jatrophihabitantaceae bacterium]